MVEEYRCRFGRGGGQGVEVINTGRAEEAESGAFVSSRGAKISVPGFCGRLYLRAGRIKIDISDSNCTLPK